MKPSGHTMLFFFAAIALAGAALPPGAAAESVLPPENSAVAQYTEQFPTAGGEADAEGQKHRNVSPGKVLGAHNAKRLARHGPDGRAVAELAAETAPSPVPEPAMSAPAGGRRGGNTGSVGGGGAAPGAGSPEGAPPADRGRAAPGPGPKGAAFTLSEANGSSGPETVLSGAFGLQPDGIGLLLPFLLVIAMVAAFTFAIRQRRRQLTQ